MSQILKCLSSCVVVAAAFSAGCDTGLPNAHGSGGAISDAMTLSFVPDATSDHAPAIGWEVLRAPGALPRPEQVRLYEGKLTSTELRAIVGNKTTPAIDARLVPSDAFAFGKAVAVASESSLLEGDYTVVAADSGWNRSFHVVAAEDPPVLARAFPPAGVSASANALIYCMPDAASVAPPAGEAALTLEPSNVSGSFIAPLADGSRCVRFTGDGSVVDGIVAPPPTLDLGGSSFRLEPGLLSLSAGTPVDFVKCHVGERQLGPGCATVLDDRIKVRSPQAPVAWSIGGSTGVTFQSTRGGSRFVIRGLRPQRSFTLDVTTIDTTGFEATTIFSGTTLAPMPHLVINEVYAHPIGPRPDQEWVEVYNDGATDQSLYGFALAVADGASPLPAVIVPSGGFGLVVSFGYQNDDAVDLSPPVTCPLARVAKLGAKGLSLSGQLLHLLGPDGSVVSSFPAIAQHTAGVSAVRSSSDALDDDPASFSLGAGPPTPCTPNTPASP